MRIALVFLTLHVCFAQTAPPTSGFLYKQLQAFQSVEKFKPQSNSQRLHLYLLSLVGPLTLVTEAGAAGLSHAIASPRQWGDGMSAYGLRFGNDLAYNAVRQSITFSAAVLLREDDRYFLSEDSGAWRRTRHAIAGVFTAHKANGRTVFAISSLLGIAGASGISRAWSPDNWQTPSATARSFGISVAGAAGLNIVREFLPDLIHRHWAASGQPQENRSR
jgi:hypothetical protein